MIAFLIHNMAPIMFLALVVFLLLGYPVAFSLAFVGLSFALIGIWLGLFEPSFLQLLPERVWQIMSNETLLAIPFFTFMGLILERTGMAEELLDTAGKMFGPVRGGVAYAVIVVGALLAATTGVVAASVIAMGLISLPIMLRYGYDRRLASGVIAASGTLAQIIPPSLVLIIMADQLGRSVGDMYKGAIVPGLVLTGLYMGYVLLTTIIFPKSAPGASRRSALVRRGRRLSARDARGAAADRARCPRHDRPLRAAAGPRHSACAVEPARQSRIGEPDIVDLDHVRDHRRGTRRLSRLHRGAQVAAGGGLAHCRHCRGGARRPPPLRPPRSSDGDLDDSDGDA